MTTLAIKTFALAKSLGRTRALAGLDLQVDEGEVVGCLGPNEAGKTTLLRLLLGLLVRPLSRVTWIMQRIILGVVAIVCGGLLAGVATWVGAASDHADVDLASMFGASLNVAVPALLLLGVGFLAFATVPRLVSVVTFALLVWLFLLEIVGGVVKINHWILDLSAFHQMAAAPATPVSWTANATMIALAIVAGGLGVTIFHRRDLRGE